MHQVKQNDSERFVSYILDKITQIRYTKTIKPPHLNAEYL